MCEAPVVLAEHESGRGVRRLVASLTRLRGRAVVILSEDDERPMDDLLVRLPGRLVLMAVDASRVHHDAGDGLEQSGLRRGVLRGFAAAAACERKDDEEQRDDAHGASSSRTKLLLQRL